MQFRIRQDRDWVYFHVLCFYQQPIYECGVSRRKTDIHKTGWPILLKNWFNRVYNIVVQVWSEGQYCTKTQIPIASGWGTGPCILKCCLFDVPLVRENALKVHQFLLYLHSFRYEEVSQENKYRVYFFLFHISNFHFIAWGDACTNHYKRSFCLKLG